MNNWTMSDWSLKALLDEGVRILEEHQIPDASVDAWILMSEICYVNRMDLLFDGDKIVDIDKADAFLAAIQRRATGYPVQYITGNQEFMGIPFKVNENVLIPRFDTEVLVELILETIPEGGRVLDMCTGSGCILLSIMGLKPMAEGVGVDLSPGALSVASANEKNIRGLDCAPGLPEGDTPKISWILSDLFENVSGEYDIIVSNPPYIASAEIEQLMTEVRCHEPRMALDGTADGLAFYRKITEEAPKYLKKGGMLFYEIGWDQGEAVRQMMVDQGFTHVCVKKDLAGLDRIVYGTLE